MPDLDLLYALLLVAAGLILWPDPPQHDHGGRHADAMTPRELAGLVDVDYTPDLVLVSPRGVELPFSDLWTIDDVLETLATVDAL